MLEQVYKDQLSYYNNKIEDKDNYVSIINFAKQERNKVIQRAKSVIQSENFIILEGFNPAWGNFVGLIWNDETAYSYRQSSADKRFTFVKVNLKHNDTKKVTGIDSYLFDKVNNWDTNYINTLKSKIGMSVLDGYNFMATKVTSNQNEKVPKIETIAFEQFIDEQLNSYR